jgi:hypothetical protein
MDLEMTSQVVWSCIHGLTALLIARPAFPWVLKDKLIDGLIETATAGLVRPVATKTEGERHGISRTRTRK